MLAVPLVWAVLSIAVAEKINCALSGESLWYYTGYVQSAGTCQSGNLT